MTTGFTGEKFVRPEGSHGEYFSGAYVEWLEAYVERLEERQQQPYHEYVRDFVRTMNATHNPKLWRRFIREELTELFDAIDDDNPVEELDGIVDLIWVLIGYADARHFDLDGAFKEVYRSNMTKTPGDGSHKITKGENFSKPDLLPFVESLQYWRANYGLKH